MADTDSERLELSVIESTAGVSSPGRTTDERSSVRHAPSVYEDDLPLHPANGGFHAYAFLASATLVELFCWSIPFSYGIFLNYYNIHLFPDGQGGGKIALVGTLCSGVMYLVAPICFRLSSAMRDWMPHLLASGLALVIAGLLGAAFSTRDWQFILSQGLAYALGASILYFPTVAFAVEWFPDRHGLAIGILFSGAGAGGLIMPFAIEAMLNRFGHRITFFILSGIFAVAIIPGLFWVRPRLPRRSLSSMDGSSHGGSVWTSAAFWILFACNTMQGLGNFMPGIYLPSYASDLGLSSTAASLIVSLVNGAAVPGSIVTGWASDRFDLRIVILASTLCAALSTFFLWGFSNSLAQLIPFALLYGFSAGGWSSTWSRFGSAVGGENMKVSSTAFSLMGSSRGIGNLLAGPISSALLKTGGLHYGAKNYGALILFTGATLLVSASGSLFKLNGCGISTARLGRTKRAQ
ncbi:MFS general substrate transporter [Exidia glandulosa HHB12029]|uniref:MFS general substrate transporter n=1 Tax=Exidia glandulosa HHB12029 TaxID=1314781 RepID=A0A165N6M8_EXIGL|nr:MFS general substrate transporter [Exidia glandulosa HHB12029]